jgi:hypothetical protein
LGSQVGDFFEVKSVKSIVPSRFEGFVYMRYGSPSHLAAAVMFACVKVGKSRFTGHLGVVVVLLGVLLLILHGETAEAAAGRRGHVTEMICVQLVT